MITPSIIKGIFIVGLIIIVLLALVILLESVLLSVAILIFGPLIWRIYCELMIVIFKIHESLERIRHK